MAVHRRLSRRAGMAAAVSRDVRLLQSSPPAIRRIFYLVRRHMAIPRRSRPNVYAGRLTLLRASQQVQRRHYTGPTLGWDELVAGGVEVHELPGNHVTLFQEPHVQTMAAAFRTSMAVAEASAVHQ